MTATLNKVYEAYKDSNIQFQKKYHLKIDAVQDKEHQLVNQLNAKVTPECFLLDDKNTILYSGKIDNWFYDIGKYRQVITENYLKDAIYNALHGIESKVARTEPVGCLIEL